MLDDFIPFEVIGEDDYWHMDISQLSLSELIKLRDLLKGTVSFRVLDKLVYERSNITYNSYNNLSKREVERLNETRRKPLKRSRKKFKRR